MNEHCKCIKLPWLPIYLFIYLLMILYKTSVRSIFIEKIDLKFQI